MVEVIIEVQVLRDGNLDPTGIEYNLSSLKKNSWLGVFIGGVRVVRFRTNNQGNVSGVLDPVPFESYDYLISVGGFKFTIRDSNYIVETGIIAGISDIVEDTDNEGLPNIGSHEIDLRYD